jgi:thiol-disulfide isomerase/thioredoxin
MKIFPAKSSLFLILLLILLITGGSCASGRKSKVNTESAGLSQPENSSTNWADQSVWLLGYFNPILITRPPYSEWYNREYNGYQPLQGVIEKLASEQKDDLSIVTVLGIWCPDSRREVPRFMKIVELMKFPAEQMTFIGVDNEKLSPLGDYDKLGIERVPTFIIYKNKIELGRIIENPVASLEQDLLDIFTRK